MTIGSTMRRNKKKSTTPGETEMDAEVNVGEEIRLV